MTVADEWPIAAAALSLGNADPGSEGEGNHVDRWQTDLLSVADEGFSLLDLTDSWVSVGSLSDEYVRDLRMCADEAGLAIASVSAIRRSVIDADHADDNVAYAHRAIDAAAMLGASVVSFGLHQELTPEQRERLWFWTAPGHHDDPHDPDAWRAAVRAFRELGQHAAEVGLLLSLEMYEDTFLGSAASSIRLVEDIDLDTVGVNPDTGNLIRRTGPVDSWSDTLRAVLPYTNFWHVKNYARYEDTTTGTYFALPSYLESGLINYREAMAWAIDAGFRGVISVEHYGGDGLSVSAANRDYLRARGIPRRPPSFGVSRVRQAPAWGGLT